jgi:hypothetical protein
MRERVRHPRGRIQKRITVPGNLRIACDQFNAGQYYECHETLEEIWQEEAGGLRDCYKGLIQLAAAFVHLTRANYVGAERLLRTAREYLAPYEPSALGFDIAGLLAAAGLAYDHLVALGPERAMDFDLSLAPVWTVDLTATGPSAVAHRAWGFARDGTAEDMVIDVIE